MGRPARIVVFEGKEQRFSDLIARFGIPYGIAMNRIDRGWPVERIFSEPVKTRRRAGGTRPPRVGWSPSGVHLDTTSTAAPPAAAAVAEEEPPPPPMALDGDFEPLPETRWEPEPARPRRGGEFLAGAEAFRDALIRDSARLVELLPQVLLSAVSVQQLARAVDLDELVRRRSG